MRVLFSATIVAMSVLLWAAGAQAQPGAQPYPSAPPPGWAPAPGQPQPYLAPPPAGSCTSCVVPGAAGYYPVTTTLTAEDHRLLLRGEISDGEYYGGAVTSVLFGFGMGQAVQGRWHDTGWIFTLGESVSAAVVVAGLARALGCFDGGSNDGGSDCDDRGAVNLMMAGAIGLTVFRVWELVDVFSVPPAHNRRVRSLRQRLGFAPTLRVSQVQPYLAPSVDGGAMAGFAARF